MIFTAPWVTERFGRPPEIEIAFPINFPTPQLRFGVGNLFLMVTPEKITIFCRDRGPDAFTRMQDLAARILADLPHTPVSAVGMNFVFRTEDAGANVLNLFRLDDNPDLANREMNIRETHIRRSMLFRDRTLNLALIFSPERATVTFDFNFHSDVSTTTEAAAKIAIGMADLQATVHSIVHDIYGHDIIEEEAL
jgi:hypothetical protein